VTDFAGAVPTEEALGFSVDMSNLDRAALLEDAAQQLQRLERATLGSGGASEESAAAAVARELSTESAQFGPFPDVHRIVDEDFLMHGNQVPVKFEELSRDFDFFWIRFPIGLRPLRNWGFTRLEVGVDLSPDDVAGHLRPRAYQILPDKHFQTILETDGHVDVHLDGNFDLSARTPVAAAQVGPVSLTAGAGGGVGGSGGLGVAGNYRYQMKKARIDHTAVGMDKVFWRLDSTRLFEEDSPEMIVVLQVPTGVEQVRIAAALQAYRRLNLLSAGFQSAVRGLPLALRNYFAGGAPIRDESEWDLSPALSKA
jgi:hypothetical protein